MRLSQDFCRVAKKYKNILGPAFFYNWGWGQKG